VNTGYWIATENLWHSPHLLHLAAVQPMRR
jgi:hypothetical protein